MNFQIERLKRVAQRKNDTWQGGLVRMPAWIEQEGQRPFRPWAPLWVSLKTRVVHTSDFQQPEERSTEAVLSSLADFACGDELAGYRPGKVQVSDPALAEHLRELLAEVDIEVELHNRLFALEEVISDMAENIGGQPPVPSALDAKGVTIDSIRAFAKAASEFYRARPWQHLTDEDLIEVESPFVDASLRFLSVLGGGGMAFGIGFYESPGQLESLLEQTDSSVWASEKHWSVLFGPLTELPFSDADLWEDYNLPVAEDDAYPLAVCYLPRGKVRRAPQQILAFLEGLMRVLARSSESQIDNSRWKKTVTTSVGKMNFTLALPQLLDQATIRKGSPNPRSMERDLANIARILEEHDFDGVDEMNEFLQDQLVGGQVPALEPETASEKAQDLAYQAFNASGRKQLQLARKALEICPNCTDGYTVLAERQSDVKKARDLYAQGVDAGRRALGDAFFEENAGHFWGITKTRPYMRALLGLAQCLHNMGDFDEALTHYRELLRLNPNDNQGVRHLLWPFLLELGRDSETQELLSKYKNDKNMAVWCYAQTLVTFRQKGNTATARKHLQKAESVNKHVLPCLLGKKELPEFFPSEYSIGSKEEAIICADLLGTAWDDTPGAIEWLQSQTKVGASS
jgi:tetratricopeptide (TPR) repeat protein